MDTEILVWALGAVLVLLLAYLAHFETSLNSIRRDVHRIDSAQFGLSAQLSDVHRQFDRIEQTLHMIWAELKSKADRS